MFGMFLYVAFPKTQHSPPLIPQYFVNFDISLNIAFNLGMPKLFV